MKKIPDYAHKKSSHKKLLLLMIFVCNRYECRLKGLSTKNQYGFISYFTFHFFRLDSIVMAVIYLVYLVILIFNKKVESLATAVVHFFESRCCRGSTCLVTGGDESLPPDSEKRNLVNQMALGSSYTNSKDDDKARDKSFMAPQYIPIEGAVKEEIPMESPASQSKTDSQSQNEDDNESSTVEDKSTKGKLPTLLKHTNTLTNGIVEAQTQL